MDKNLYAVDANSGRLMWKYKTGGIVYSTIIVDDGVLYFGSTDGYLITLELKRKKQ